MTEANFDTDFDTDFDTGRIDPDPASDARAADSDGVSVADMAPGGRGTVIEILAGDGEVDLEFRLLELGLEVGQEIVLLHVGPLGDPVALGFDDYIIAVRRQDAKKILVTCDD